MEIVHIFAERLYSFRYSKKHKSELRRILTEWNDAYNVYEFLKKNQHDLQGKTVLYVAEQISNDAGEIEETLFQISQGNGGNLETFFRQLDNKEFQLKTLSKRKGRINYLRIYALKIDDDCFIVTGGAIKLTKLMQDRPHTKKELAKLEQCKEFLKENGIFDSDSFHEFINQAQ